MVTLLVIPWIHRVSIVPDLVHHADRPPLAVAGGLALRSFPRVPGRLERSWCWSRWSSSPPWFWRSCERPVRRFGAGRSGSPHEHPSRRSDLPPRVARAFHAHGVRRSAGGSLASGEPPWQPRRRVSSSPSDRGTTSLGGGTPGVAKQIVIMALVITISAVVLVEGSAFLRARRRPVARGREP